MDDFVDCGNIQNLGQAFTVELWSYRLGSTGSFGNLLAIDGPSWGVTGGFLIFDNNAEGIVARIRNHLAGTETGASLETAVPNRVWRHYVVVWNKPALTTYRNGVIVSRATWPHDVGWNVFRVGMGGWSTHMYHGLIDDVRIYATALPSAQIQSKYYAGLQSLLARGLISQEEYQQRLTGVQPLPL